MNRRILSGITVLIAATLVSVGPLLTRSPAQDTATKPDNTEVNKRDRAATAKTADSQKMNSADRETTQKIRKAIMDDKSLSTYAHNIKIITRNGAVTLKGPVRSEEEKSTIEARAKEAAGSDKITNQLSVAPSKSSS